MLKQTQKLVYDCILSYVSAYNKNTLFKIVWLQRILYTTLLQKIFTTF